ncbi:hypothetical protein NLI96_g12270 [Meripilus lineatus]|uniref:F-box domain-containing protein n=1 Tax=Meripilus lineatus TaxID=2056292 RepID=A0AAD5UQE0_9APHY|nr:hypothetical protein NLI96_g12270 [Physisporinus lineatus]
MDPSQTSPQEHSQDVSQDLASQENTAFPIPVAVEPHTVPLRILSHSSSPLPSPIASSSNADLSISLMLQQSYPVAHVIPNLLYYAPVLTGQYIQPGWNPETGLPMELWLKILDILFRSRSANTLLACAMTCRYLHGPAQDMIEDLNTRRIRSWVYEDIDQLVKDVRDTPRDAKRITEVRFLPEERDDKSAGSAVALSVAPLRLAGQRVLTNMRSLELFGNAMPEPHFHPLVCPLYGRAFPHVTLLRFGGFQFPSFMDFAFFVASFPALTSLHLQFAEIFLRWLLQRCGRYPEKIDFNESMFEHSWGRQVLKNCSGNLEELTIWLESRVRRSQGDLIRNSWLDAFHPGYPVAWTVKLKSIKESDIPMMKAFISHHMAPTQILKLESIWPTAEDFHSFSWKTLDILLFSWYMLHGRGNGQTLFLRLRVPWQLRDKQKAIKEEAIDVKENIWLHSFFPLNTAVGEGMWLARCREW